MIINNDDENDDDNDDDENDDNDDDNDNSFFSFTNDVLSNHTHEIYQHRKWIREDNSHLSIILGATAHKNGTGKE